MEMSYFRALIFCTQTSVNPLRQTILPHRGTAVNKQWIFKKPISSKLRSCGLLLISFSPSFPVEYRGGQTSWEDIFEHSMYWDLKAEGWCVIFMRQLKGLHLILRRAECRRSVAALRQLKRRICKTRSRAWGEFWAWSLNLHLLTSSCAFCIFPLFSCTIPAEATTHLEIRTN